MSVRDDDVLDTLIDRVAHDLTAGNPPPTIVPGVRARIVGRYGRPPVVWQRPLAVLATVAIAFALTAALLLIRGVGGDEWPERRTSVPVQQQTPPIVGSDGPVDAFGRPAPRDPPYLTMTDVGRVSRSGPAGTGIRPDQVTATALAGAAPLSLIEPLDVPPIDDPALVAEMSALVIPIEIEPLQVVPLEVQ